MPGWDSLQTVATVHGAFQLAGLILLVVVAALAALAAYQLRSRQWPEWLDLGDYQLRSRFLEIGLAAVFALLVVTHVAAYSYGVRYDNLVAAAERSSADRIGRLVADSKKKHPAAEKTKVRASILLISGCMDNQTSRDGDENGLFTGTLRKVWNGGKFKGNYRKLRDVIVSKMPSDQTPNYYVVGASNPKFEAQSPFTI